MDGGQRPHVGENHENKTTPPVGGRDRVGDRRMRQSAARSHARRSRDHRLCPFRFRGTSQQVGIDVPDLGKVEGPCQIDENGGGGSWNDCISSIRVLPGWQARIYGDKNFRGAVLDVTADVPDLEVIRGDCSGNYNDCVSSIRVIKVQ